MLHSACEADALTTHSSSRSIPVRNVDKKTHLQTDMVDPEKKKSEFEKKKSKILKEILKFGFGVKRAEILKNLRRIISTEKGHENADFFDGGVPYQSRRVFPRRGGLR